MKSDFDTEGLNPDPSNLPTLEPKDAFLLGDLLSPSGPYSNGPSGSNTPATPLAHVPWLRKTEYISREGVQRSGGHEPYASLNAFIFRFADQNVENMSCLHP
jgi:RNA polymerase II-associated factor 1